MRPSASMYLTFHLARNSAAFAIRRSPVHLDPTLRRQRDWPEKTANNIGMCCNQGTTSLTGQFWKIWFGETRTNGCPPQNCVINESLKVSKSGLNVLGQ